MRQRAQTVARGVVSRIASMRPPALQDLRREQPEQRARAGDARCGRPGRGRRTSAASARAPAVITPGQRPAGNRERPLQRAGRQDHARAPCMRRDRRRARRRSRASRVEAPDGTRPVTICAPLAVAARRTSSAPRQ